MLSEHGRRTSEADAEHSGRDAGQTGEHEIKQDDDTRNYPKSLNDLGSYAVG